MTIRAIKIFKKRLKHGYKIKCVLCKYEWFPKLKNPIICPKCKQKMGIIQ